MVTIRTSLLDSAGVNAEIGLKKHYFLLGTQEVLERVEAV
jgi:hypothetical protein